MTIKTAVFRCDGGPKIGNGHIMRSFVLAKKLSEENIKCYFLLKKYNLFLKNYIKTDFKILFIKRDSYLEIKKKILKLNCDYFIIDNYHFPFILEKKIKQLTRKIILIEDFPEKKHIADLVIDQNFYRLKKNYVNIQNKKCKFLLGEKYSLINPNLKKIKKNKKKKKNISNILLTFGGFDKHKVGLKILKYLKFIKKKLKITLLVNRRDGYCNEILKYSKKNKLFVNLLTNSSIVDVIHKVDFAIVSGGVTAKELILFDIPCFIISTSNDQLNNCKKYKNLKKARYLGHWNKIKKNLFINEVNNLFNKEKKILNKKEKRIFDFDGSTRITKHILNL